MAWTLLTGFCGTFASCSEGKA